MHDFRRRRQFRRALFSPFSVILLLVLVFLLARGTWNIFKKERTATADSETAKLHLAELERREASLLSEIERLKSERGSEEEIRKRFGAAREGEGVIVIVEEEHGEMNATTSKSFWRALIDWFKK